MNRGKSKRGRRKGVKTSTTGETGRRALIVSFGVGSGPVKRGEVKIGPRRGEGAGKKNWFRQEVTGRGGEEKPEFGIKKK